MSFIRIAQKVGLSLDEIRSSLASLPASRTPNKADWARLSQSWAPQLDEHIAMLQRLRDELTECIGCGCLSLRSCALYNHDDVAAGARLGAALPARRHPRGRRAGRLSVVVPVATRSCGA